MVQPASVLQTDSVHFKSLNSGFNAASLKDVLKGHVCPIEQSAPKVRFHVKNASVERLDVGGMKYKVGAETGSWGTRKF